MQMRQIPVDLLSYPLISNLLIVHFSLAKVDLSSGFFLFSLRLYKPNCSPFFISSIAGISAFNGSLLLLLSLLFKHPCCCWHPCSCRHPCGFCNHAVAGVAAFAVAAILSQCLPARLTSLNQFRHKTLLIFLTFPGNIVIRRLTHLENQLIVK